MQATPLAWALILVALCCAYTGALAVEFFRWCVS